MDKDFLEKLESVTEWKQVGEKSEQMEFTLSFSNEEEGLVRIESSRGNFIYKLKPLNELFTNENNKPTSIG